MPEWMHLLATCAVLAGAAAWLAWRLLLAPRRGEHATACRRCPAAAPARGASGSLRRSPQLKILG